MCCPTLDELPDPPPGKSGWPWTQEPSQLPAKRSSGEPWPKISIVTPSYNQGQFIEATIRSVLLQGYSNLEYVIIDGGSTDESVDVIRKYEPWIDHWVSEPDDGQSQAINKGIGCTSGEIIAYINSDDFYAPDAFKNVVTLFKKNPSSAWLIGKCRYIDAEEGTTVNEAVAHRPVPEDRVAWITRQGWGHPQPSTFWRRVVFERCGFFREDMDYVFDSEHGVRALFASMVPLVTEDLLAVRTLHDACKTVESPERFEQEQERFAEIYAPRLTIPEKRRLRKFQFGRALRKARGEQTANAVGQLLSFSIRNPNAAIGYVASRLRKEFQQD